MKLITNILLMFVALFLVILLTPVNFAICTYKYGFKSISGFFRSQAVAIDRFEHFNFRTLWNTTMKTENGYTFGNFNETLSSALGKNERDNTLSMTGKILVWILNKIDKNHCQNSIDENLKE